MAGRLFPGCRTFLTEARGHAGHLVSLALSEGFDALIACGGDGTAAEVVNGWLSCDASLRGDSAVGLCPLGSGCDLARHFGISRDPEAALHALARARVARLDVGKVDFPGESRYFLNIVTLGLGGDVGRAVESSGKRFGGTASYLLAVLSALWNAKPRSLKLSWDGRAEAEAPYHLVAVANTSSTGGGMNVAPRADAQDGKLDVVTVAGLSRGQLLRRLPSVYWGGHLDAPGIRCERVSALEVDGPADAGLNIDGESAGSLPARFAILPAALPFLLPN